MPRKADYEAEATWSHNSNLECDFGKDRKKKYDFKKYQKSILLMNLKNHMNFKIRYKSSKKPLAY